MSLEQLSYLAQIVASFGVFLSMIFVGMQIKQNTAALQRNEHNTSMEEWAAIRQTVATNREIAELMTTGLSGERALDAADQLRMEQMLMEYGWASFHIWDRAQSGVFVKGTFESTAGPLFCSLLRTERGRNWWRRAKSSGFMPGFVASVDAMLNDDSEATPPFGH